MRTPTRKGRAVLLLLVALVVVPPIAWAVSVGAVRELRRARAVDPRVGCQAWVAVRGLSGGCYRCARPGVAGSPWCRIHINATTDAGPEVSCSRRIDEPQAVGRALAIARVGIPIAAVLAAALLAAIAWATIRYV